MALVPSSREIVNPAGANLFLGNAAAHHDGQPNLGPHSNRVQTGVIDLINTSSPLGRPSKANPVGEQTS